MMLYAAFAATYGLFIIALTAILNVLTFPRLSHEKPPSQTPFVSILIPARNEADVIGKTVRNLLKQSYTNFELIVLDDSSDDGTGEVATEASQGDKRFRLVHGKPLPDGWMGKSWACHNLSQHARGEILIFTDADVMWQANALEAILAHFQQTQADLLTVWPQQIMITPAERLIVSLASLVLLGYLPLVMVHHSPLPRFASANGQCMIWKREGYDKVGGHQAVANEVLDDVNHAIIAKQNKLRLRMVLSEGYLKTRMYSNWESVRNGFAKNVLAGYLNNVPFLLVGSVAHWLMFLFPFAMLFVPGFRLWGLLLIIWGMTLRALTAASTRQPILDAIFMPLSVILMTIIAGQSILWHYTGGPRWKGRIIKRETA